MRGQNETVQKWTWGHEENSTQQKRTEMDRNYKKSLKEKTGQNRTKEDTVRRTGEDRTGLKRTEPKEKWTKNCSYLLSLSSHFFSFIYFFLRVIRRTCPSFPFRLLLLLHGNRGKSWSCAGKCGEDAIMWQKTEEANERNRNLRKISVDLQIELIPCW